jgi:hypothetical protein
MIRPGLVGERAIALFLLALLAFNPPILSIFSAEAFVLGLPLLYVYLFCAWAGVIALVGLQAVAAGRSPEAGGEAAGRRAPRGNG